MSLTSQQQHRSRDACNAVLILTLILSGAWSFVRLMWNDEFLSFYGDSTASLRTVWNVQLHSPISLDPPTYHLLSHLSMNLLGRNAEALRLPALLGFMLLEVCLYSLVRRLAGDRAALIAMAFPLMTASFRYSVEGRPYGLLLGLYALSLLCWYTAAAKEKGPRMLPLAGLAVAIALAITSHYFGVLVLLPVSIGELARTVQRRRFDWPLVGALTVGFASIGIVLPFQNALLPYRQHYYTSAVNLHNITQGYREIFLRYNSFPVPVQRVLALLLVVATLSLAVAAVRLFRHKAATQDRALWVGLWTALLAFAALPFFGYLFGKFVTHTMEVRYVIAALIAFAVALALVLEKRLRSDAVFYGLFSGMLVVATLAAAVQIRAERHNSDAILAALTVPPALTAELETHPGERLYTQSLTDLFTNSYYAPTPLIRERITLLYNANEEVHWLGHNTNAVTAEYLQRFSPLAVSPYTQFFAQRAPLLLQYGTGWEWVGKDLQARHMLEQPLGTALNGKLLRVETTR